VDNNCIMKKLYDFNRQARTLSDMTLARISITEAHAKTLQRILDDMQSELDDIVNELTRPEM